MLRRTRHTASLAALLTLLSTGAALAAGRETVTETQHEHNVVLFSNLTLNPCTGEAGTITATATNSVFHVTFFETSDEFWITGTSEGVVTFTPEAPEGVSGSGHFAMWFGESHNNKNEVQHSTSTFVFSDSDGSHVAIHGKTHLSTNASGEVKASFETESVHCS
jgi:hypothetical protein